MLIKFPQISNDIYDSSFIVFGDRPYAKHNIVTKSIGRQLGFLTEHSLMFIIQGEKYFHFGDKTICVNSNELILVKRGIYTISELVPDNGSFEALIIFIHDKFLQTIYNQSNTEISDSKTTYVKIYCNNLLQQFQSQYLNYFGGDFQGKQQILQLKLQELFLLLQNSNSSKEVNLFMSSCLNKESIEIEYIVKSNLFLPLSIEDYAKLCMRSLASFKRDFKKQLNASPKQWINQQRILYAVSLLNSSNKTVNEIAFECGFESTSHFIKLFKNQIGVTPNASRTKAITI